jgi:two-component system chemotaxis response regulator CheY
MKILIVDDSEPMRRLIRTFVADLVHEVIERGDGREALEAYRENRPDVVLMDLKLQTMDGLTATRQIRSSYPDARIVMVSQWDDAALRNEASSAGADNYVAKSDLLPLRRILAAMRDNTT